MLHFCCEKTIDVVPSDSEPVGIDVGVSKQATLSRCLAPIEKMGKVGGLRRSVRKRY